MVVHNKLKLIVISAIVALSTPAQAEDTSKCFTQNDAELPSGSPSKASADTPRQYASWVGVYQGYMDASSSSGGGDVWCKKLLVESVESDGTWEGSYAYGNWGRFSASHVSLRRETIAEDGTLTYTLGSGVRFEYKLSADGNEATGTAFGNQLDFPAKLKRIR